MYEEDQGLGRPAAFFIGAKYKHKRCWKNCADITGAKPIFVMLVRPF